MSDARQRLLDALAEVERLGAEGSPGPWVPVARADTISIKSGHRGVARIQRKTGAEKDAELIIALHALLPTLVALREVVEMHEIGTGDLCRACSYIDDEDCVEGEEYPCHTLRTLTRQFEE